MYCEFVKQNKFLLKVENIDKNKNNDDDLWYYHNNFIENKFYNVSSINAFKLIFLHTNLWPLKEKNMLKLRIKEK